MPTLSDLNVELLTLILEHVYATSPSALPLVARVNRTLQAVSYLFIHRRKTVEFDIDHGPANTILRRWLDDEEVLGGVRHLTIAEAGEPLRYRDPDFPGLDEVDSKWDTLDLFLQKLRRLQRLDWSHRDPIPHRILIGLEKYHPAAELKIFTWSRTNTRGCCGSDPAEVALAQCRALTAIEACIWTKKDAPQPQLRSSAFDYIIVRAPNLRSIAISVASYGCVVHRLSASQHRELVQLRQQFLENTSPNPAVRRLAIDGYALETRTLDHWSRLVVLDNLEAFECLGGYGEAIQFVHSLADRLPNIRYLGLDLSAVHDDLHAAAKDFFSSCNSLEGLSLWSWRKMLVLEDVLPYHGRSLKTLRLHDRVASVCDGNTMYASLNLCDTTVIQRHCTKLRDLVFDIDLESLMLDIQSEQDIFHLLSRLNLERLQLDFGLTLFSEVRFKSICARRNHRSEWLNLEAELASAAGFHAIKRNLRMAWGVLFKDKDVGSRALDVEISDIDLTRDPSAPYWAVEMQINKVLWKIRPQHRDNQPGDCTIKETSGRHRRY